MDRQLTNLTRFSLFFPERRNFFIENSDLFARFGFRQIRPFSHVELALTAEKRCPSLEVPVEREIEQRLENQVIICRPKV